jgi:hypothetical protein
MRYFSAGRPTKLVRDGRVEAYADDRAMLSATAPPSAAIAATTMSAATTHGQADHTRVFQPLPADQVAASVASSPVARPQRRWMEYAFVAAGAVVAVVVFVALEGGGSGKAGIAPAAFVTKAAQQTLAEHTADFTMSATVQSGGQTMAMSGNGQIDLANGSMSFNAGATGAGGSVAEDVLDVGGNSYLKLTVNGHSPPLSGGRQWIETPFTATSAGSFATASPDSALELLSQQGARVTPLGTQNIGGQACRGYSVIPSTEAMQAGAKQEFAKIGLSTAETSAALQAVQDVQPPTITAWFGTKTNLTCQVTLSVQFGPPTSSSSGGVQSELTFTHYGAPVTITAPPATDTVSVQQYLQGTAV